MGLTGSSMFVLLPQLNARYDTFGRLVAVEGASAALGCLLAGAAFTALAGGPLEEKGTGALGAGDALLCIALAFSAVAIALPTFLTTTLAMIVDFGVVGLAKGLVFVG
jgi:hypothetical protein